MEIVVTNTHPPLTSCQTLVQALHKQYRISSQPKPCGRCSHPHAAEAEAGVVYSFSRATPLVNVSISYSPHTGLHLSGFPKRIHRPFPISSFPYTESHNTGLTVSANIISPIKKSGARALIPEYWPLGGALPRSELTYPTPLAKGGQLRFQ